MATQQNGRRNSLQMPIHATKADVVAEWIRARILSGDLVPGTALQQEELARQLDVSSTPVREAFLTLEAEGYVERRPPRDRGPGRPPARSERRRPRARPRGPREPHPHLPRPRPPRRGRPG